MSTYTKEITDKIVARYQATKDVEALLVEFPEFSKSSLIAKLSSLGIYEKKPYLNKLGAVPIKKEEYIERLAELLNVNIELLESLEKANKNVLALLHKTLSSHNNVASDE